MTDGFIVTTFKVMMTFVGSDPLRTLYESIQTLRRDPLSAPEGSRTAKLLAQGRARMARKVGEEAIEVAIDAMRDDRGAVVMESADLLYNLVVLLADLEISPDEVMAEIQRRATIFGIAEKLPKTTEEPAAFIAPALASTGKRSKSEKL